MITLSPAYGHDYKVSEEAIAAYNAGKDFILNDISSRWHGLPANNADLKGEGIMKLRYCKLSKVICINAATGEEEV
jgi:hypothetical protein